MEPFERRQIVQEVLAGVEQLLQRTQSVPHRPVLSATEAANFVGRRSYSAFRDWCRAYQVRPCAHGRYSLAALKRGMEREARGVYQHGKGVAA